jgi:apolipoprotein N-acyltransferase
MRLTGYRSKAAFLFSAAALVGAATLGWSVLSGAGFGLNDAPYLALIVFHAAAALPYISGRRPFKSKLLARAVFLNELLGSVSLLFFLFSYIFALNANMDYVQRFIATGGGLRLAANTTDEQLIAFFRYLPFLAANSYLYLYLHIARRTAVSRLYRGTYFLTGWALPLTLLSAFLTAVSFPSFLSLSGTGFLAWFALVPFFLALRHASPGRGVFLGVCFGVFFTLTCNYWLGTFSLVSLLVTIVIFTALYLLFMTPAVLLYRAFSGTGNLQAAARFLSLPAAWTAFDYLRSGGFIGFPWGMLGLTQYGFLPLIQIASITGVWGVSFIVLLVNSGLAESLAARLHDGRPFRFAPAVAAASVFALAIAWGQFALAASTRVPASRPPIDLALVQQNSDPRKHDYRVTFEALKRLTDRAVSESKPDLVVWSETAFVPNIARWGAMAPGEHPNAALVHEFLAYQRSLRTWLLTGNDDYRFRMLPDGTEERWDYNAAVLFSPEGERVETYHKIHLVPFTEHFPFKNELPRLYELLLRFDVTLWEPGTERTVFRHPGFTFSTPICFEDAFPDDIRRFVLQGAEVILNISNDYWSLTEVEAKQHYIASLFRAVENRRPLVRATASGLTAYVDPWGRLRGSLPYYEEAYLTVRLEIPELPPTFYTRRGDWFPLFCLGVTVLFALLAASSTAVGLIRRRTRAIAPIGPARRSGL